MKILLICEAVFPENKGGLERWMTWLGRQLNNKGYEVSYLNASGVSEERGGVKYFSVATRKWHYIGNGKRSINQSIRFALSIRSWINKIDPDVIYSVQAPIFSIFSLAMWPRRRWLFIVEWIEIWSLKYWQSYLGAFLGTIGFGLQFLATKLADVRVVFSIRCLEQLSKKDSKNILLPGLHMDDKVVKIPTFKQRDDVLFLGRFVEEKQPLLALNAVYELRNLGWTGVFHIVGTGPLKPIIERKIQCKSMSTYVNLIENASEDKLEECFKRSFALIHPSKREGYGLAMIEAASRGVTTILIDYPENASVDLAISPEYVSATDHPSDLATLIMDARKNQEINFQKLSIWAAEVLPGMNASNSVDKLIAIFDNQKQS